MAQRNSARPQIGDLTGRNKAALIAANRERLLERQDEVTLAEVAEEEATRVGVFNPATNQRVNVAPDVVIVDDAEAAQSSEVVEDPRIEVAQVRAAVLAQRRPEVIAQSTKVVARVDCDIENMTFGMGNNYTFKAGRQYEMSRDLFDYMDEKGFIRHSYR